MSLTFRRALPLLISSLHANADEIESNWAAMQTWISKLTDTVTSIVDEVNALGGRTVRIFDTIAQVPGAFGPADAGTLVYVNDYQHLLRWTGTAWSFADGGNRFIALFTAAPGAGWSLCDGSSQGYLVLGSTLTVGSLTLPNLAGSPAYLKSANAYSGTIVGAAGSSAGSTASLSGVTGGPNAHITIREKDPADFTESIPSDTHTHGAGTLSVDSHSHGVGSLDMAHLNVLPYFRQ